ncbi:hypothetical protein NDU88_005364 [Pleurodeles waltl]|uniref:Uncharacterized protein n=1 Tax=Pleurodeles waltl TaxID=8319 RepID=A0AAV7TAK8_PLEWA|nr:hypothetical protein NDU88_005364 [Pleurodeles waltl]
MPHGAVPHIAPQPWPDRRCHLMPTPRHCLHRELWATNSLSPCSHRSLGISDATNPHLYHGLWTLLTMYTKLRPVPHRIPSPQTPVPLTPASSTDTPVYATTCGHLTEPAPCRTANLGLLTTALQQQQHRCLYHGLETLHAALPHFTPQPWSHRHRRMPSQSRCLHYDLWAPHVVVLFRFALQANTINASAPDFVISLEFNLQCV